MNENQDFTKGSIPKKMIHFMFPILGALILQAMYGAVDLLIVGKFGTASGISGVSTGTSIMNTITFFFVSVSVGVTVLLGNYLGSGEHGKIGKLIGNSVCFFAAGSLVIAVLMIVFARPIALLMQAPEEALDNTVLYVRICGGGFIFVIFYNFISSIFRGLGDSKLPLLFVAIACIANVFGDLLLVAVFRLDVAGAAIATVAAQALSVLLSLLIIRRKKLPFKIHKADFTFGSEIGHFIKIGAPLALQSLLTNVTFMALCAFVNRLGLAASSGYGIAERIQSFVMLIPSSLMQCMAPFVSQNVGANRPDRAKSAMKCGMTIGASIGIVIGIIAFFRGEMLAGIFSDNPEYITRAAEFLRGFAPEAVVTSILFSFLGYFNGHGRSLFVMLQSIAQSLLIRLPMSYLMSIRPNASLTGIGLAAPTATVFGILACFWYYRRVNKQGTTKL